MKGKIFNTQEVQSMISGNKTQFREVIKNQTPLDFVCDMKPSLHHANNRFFLTGQSHDWWFEECPYQVGQKIFCKESFYQAFKKLMYYKASWKSAYYYKNEYYRNRAKCIGIEWIPAQHMKQEHSRLTLQIKEIKVERYLGYISEKDAFEVVWNATHKKPEEKFEANSWVWVIDFEVVK
jgi:hypothetical protein